MSQKIKITLILVLIFSSVTFAQKKLEYGVRAGLNLSRLPGDSQDISDELRTRTSFHIGGMVELHLLEKLSLQSEILYSGQGADFAFENGSGSTEFVSAAKLDYVTIPVLAKYYLAEDVLSVGFGPQFGILVKAEQEQRGRVPFGEPSEVDIKDIIEPVDLGLAFQLEAKLKFGLSLGLRYGLGLSNVNSEGSANDKNTVFQFSLGYYF